MARHRQTGRVAASRKADAAAELTLWVSGEADLASQPPAVTLRSRGQAAVQVRPFVAVGEYAEVRSAVLARAPAGGSGSVRRGTASQR
jgi:hypothetical protein